MCQNYSSGITENSQQRDVILLLSKGHLLGQKQRLKNKEAGFDGQKGQNGSHSKLAQESNMVGYQPIRVQRETSVSRSLFPSVNLLGKLEEEIEIHCNHRE